MKKKTQGTQRNRKVGPIQRENNRSTETVPEKHLMADQLDGDFQTMVSKMLKDLKENVKEDQKQYVNKMEISLRKQKT